MNIILGSASPRRRELMKGIDIPFTCVSIDADEHFPATLKAGDIPLYIARQKAKAYKSQLTKDDMLITADTIVWLNAQMLGKPHSEDEAKQMLRLLSGKTHQVYTGVCFTWFNLQSQSWDEYTLVDKTDVTFRELDEDEIQTYVERYRPLDKAGSYGVQEWIGYVGVTSMQGSYFNVMGFPIEKVYMFLRSHLSVCRQVNG